MARLPFQDDLKHSDYDRYLLSLFAPADKRADLLTLYAFNLEIAKTREVVSEPELGLIRLQWWQDAIEEIYAGDTRQHEVVEALKHIIEKHSLPKNLFLEIIEARRLDIETYAFADIAALEHYATHTSSHLLTLAAHTFGLNPEEKILQPLGIAWALVGILRAAPSFLPQGRCYFPNDLMQKYNLNLDHYGSQEFLENTQNIAKIIAEHAEKHLTATHAAITESPKNTRRPVTPLLLHATLAEHHLKHIHRNNYDILTCPIPSGGIVAIGKLYLSFLGRI